MTTDNTPDEEILTDEEILHDGEVIKGEAAGNKLWKANKAVALVPWLKAAGDIDAAMTDQAAAVLLMGWDDAKIDDMLTSLGIVVPVPLALSQRKEGPVFETALVFDKEGKTLAWHEPAGRHGAALPDSRDLWKFLEQNVAVLGGVAHTHPWDGDAWFSGTDVTTWSAIERGLGVKLIWPVVTFTQVKNYVWVGPGKLDYGFSPVALPVDVDGLRERSRR